MPALTEDDIEAKLAAVRADLEEQARVSALGEREKRRHVVRQLRIGRQVVPFAVIGALWAGAGIAEASPADGQYVAGLYLAVAVVYWWKARRARRRARYATVVTFCGGAWMLYAAHEGVKGWVLGALVVGGYALAAPFWYRYRIPVPADEVAEPEPWVPDLPEAPELMTVPARWAATIGSERGILPNSHLLDFEEVKHGEAYTIQLDADSGRQTTKTAVSMAPNIAAVLDRSVDEVTVDNHPTDKANKARLLIVREGENPLRKIHPYPGTEAALDLATGTAWIGRYADEDPVPWRLWVPKWGGANGIVIGKSGSGKSRLLELLIATAVDSRRVVVWVADPQGGQSIPAWVDYADWYAGDEDEITRMMICAEKFVNVRARLNVIRKPRRSVHEITPEEPMLLLVVDECHDVFVGENGARAERVARQIRKSGGGIVGSTQDADLRNFYNSRVLRGSLLNADNAVALRTGAVGSQGMLPGLDLDPSLLPDVKGIGYTAGKRVAPFRGWFEDDAPALDLAARAQMAQFEKAVVGYLGTDYTERHDRNRAAAAEVMDEMEAFDPEMIAALIDADPSLAEALQAHRARPRITIQVPTASSETEKRNLPDGWYRIPPLSPIGGLPEHEALKSPSARRIYTLVCSGVPTPADIREKSGYSESTVAQGLRDLEKAGLLRNPRHGLWEKAA